MEVMDRIHNCKNDEQLYWLTKKLIKEALERSKGMNQYRGLIGTKSEINRKEIDFDPSHKTRISSSIPFWFGYVPLNTKIVYGIACGKGFNFDSNCGYYYYVDDDSYVYDFIKYIKDWDIEDHYNLVHLINGFSRSLFEKNINRKNRFEMHKLLLKEDKGEYVFFEPIKEHSIKDFYGNGSAQCTEYALVASNLLSVLGFITYYCMDYNHAYNIFFVEDKDKDFYEGYLLDYSDSVHVYDIYNNCIGLYPFYERIETEKKKYLYLPDGSCIDIDYEKTEEELEEEDNFYEDFLKNGKRIETDDYFIVIVNNHLFKAPTEIKRNYGIEYSKNKDVKKLVKERKKNEIVL